MNKLREEFEKISLEKQQKRHPDLNKNSLFGWNEAIIKKNERFGHGYQRDITYGNIEYVRFLENKLGVKDER